MLNHVERTPGQLEHERGTQILCQKVFVLLGLSNTINQILNI